MYHFNLSRYTYYYSCYHCAFETDGFDSLSRRFQNIIVIIFIIVVTVTFDIAILSIIKIVTMFTSIIIVIFIYCWSFY